ncbi:hypothetical protein Taro_005691, partial [Colocasia esculenta]|nr:hypothetical protein [Colocasia esculenta]
KNPFTPPSRFACCRLQKGQQTPLALTVLTASWDNHLASTHKWTVSTPLEIPKHTQRNNPTPWSSSPFLELVVLKKKRSPERVFQILDMYGTIAELWPEIESVFS